LSKGLKVQQMENIPALEAKMNAEDRKETKEEERRRT
jgi:hypothetical protein